MGWVLDGFIKSAHAWSQIFFFKKNRIDLNDFNGTSTEQLNFIKNSFTDSLPRWREKQKKKKIQLFCEIDRAVFFPLLR